MLPFFKKRSKHFRAQSPIEPVDETVAEFNTNLLLNRDELRNLASRVEKWHVSIDTNLPDEERRQIHRNLIILTSVLGVRKENIHIRVFGDKIKCKALAETLISYGFSNLINESAVDEDKDVFFDEFEIAGIKYYLKSSDQVWASIKKGDNLLLETETENQYDPDAVSVHYLFGEEKVKIGYVPKEKNRHISALLQSGHMDILRVSVEELSVTPLEKLNLRLRIGILKKS